MTTPTHAALGLLIGTALGHPLVGAVTSVVIDIDHFALYARYGILKNPSLFWKTVTSEEDPYSGQRGYLHSLLIATPLSLVLCFTAPVWGLTIALSYLFGHIALDALDSADYWPLYPSKKINIRGPVGFFSKHEAFVFTALFITNIVVWL